MDTAKVMHCIVALNVLVVNTLGIVGCDVTLKAEVGGVSIACKVSENLGVSNMWQTEHEISTYDVSLSGDLVIIQIAELIG